MRTTANVSRRYFAGICALLLAAGCGLSPKYVRYTSPNRDFYCDIPAGWSIIHDSSGNDFASATFTGGLDPEFFKGIPSFAVTWRRYNAVHRLPNGTFERYAGAGDFMRQLVREVYGPNGYTKAGSDREQEDALVDGKAMTDSRQIGLVCGPSRTDCQYQATYFVVYRTLVAPKGERFGVVVNDKGQAIIRQRHAYAILPLKSGFYSIVYPATREGFDRYGPQFFRLLNTFKPLTDGPGGAVPR